MEIEKLGIRPIAAPIEANKMNIKDDNHLIDEEKCKYQRLVGKLNYLATRPNITYAFIHAPINAYFAAVERVLCYRGILLNN